MIVVCIAMEYEDYRLALLAMKLRPSVEKERAAGTAVKGEEYLPCVPQCLFFSYVAYRIMPCYVRL